MLISLHELFPLLRSTSKQVLSTSESSLQFLVLFNQETSLSFNLIVGKRCLDFESSVMIFSLNSGCETTSTQLFNRLLQFCHLYCILILNASNFTKVCILQNGMCFSKEIVNKESKLVTRS